MKKLITLVAFIFLVGWATEPTKKIVFTENQLNMLWSALEFSKANLPNSQAPAIGVNQTLVNIDSIEKVILKQYKEQLPDSSKSKP